MLHEIFYWIFNMSITASLTGAVVMLIMTVPKISKRVSVILWYIPFFRMVVPIGLNSRYSLMSLISRFATKTVVVYQPTDNVSFSMANSVTAAKSYFPIVYKTNLLDSVFNVASVVWIIVFCAIVLTLSVLYGTTMREIKNAVHLYGNIYLSENITSPGVYGIINPKIVLPGRYDENDLDYILRHETAHIRRHDNLRRLMAFFITAVHWFDPFAWIFLRRFLSDIELACDESVLSKLSGDEVKEYAKMLLNVKANGNVFISAFGGARMRIRIENILSFRKMTFAAACVSAVITAVIFYILLTNAG